MATFKKSIRVAATQLDAIPSSNLYVGDLVKYLYSTKAMTKISANVDINETIAEIEAAYAAGYQIYIIAQGDNVTNKEPTAYKNYNVGDVVASSETAKTVVAYRVKQVSDIDLGSDLLVDGYAITFANGDHYTITAKKNGSTITTGTKVDGNDTVVFTITPGEGYEITDVKLNTTSVMASVEVNNSTKVGTYSLTSVSAASTITVTVSEVQGG